MNSYYLIYRSELQFINLLPFLHSRANPDQFSKILNRRREEEDRKIEIMEKKEEKERKDEETFPFRADGKIEKSEEGEVR